MSDNVHIITEALFFSVYLFRDDILLYNCSVITLMVRSKSIYHVRSLVPQMLSILA